MVFQHKNFNEYHFVSCYYKNITQITGILTHLYHKEITRTLATKSQPRASYSNTGTLRGRYDVAVKQLLYVSTNWKDEEVRFLQRLRHPRLVMFLGTSCSLSFSVFHR